jgi:predicted lipid-binding transport protein (Tim44 family)
MAHLDIVIYALIACVLLVRLWSVLGRRNDDEPQRRNPFATPAPGKEEDAKFQLDHGGPDNAARPAFGQMILAPMSLAGTLEQIKQMDASFDEKTFLQDARAIFTTIVTGFAKGDLAEIEPLLGPTVLPGFKSAIEARQKASETLETRMDRIREAEVTTASVGESRVFITVRIVSEQENILRDAGGKVLHGTSGQTEEIIDLWTFARDVKVTGSPWLLVETRS